MHLPYYLPEHGHLHITCHILPVTSLLAYDLFHIAHHTGLHMTHYISPVLWGCLHMTVYISCNTACFIWPVIYITLHTAACIWPVIHHPLHGAACIWPLIINRLFPLSCNPTNYWLFGKTPKLQCLLFTALLRHLNLCATNYLPLPHPIALPLRLKSSCCII